MLKIGRRPVRGMIGMGVIEAHNLHSALPRLALCSHQFGGIDFEPLMSVAVSNIVTGDDSVCVRFAGTQLSYEHSAAFVGVGFFGVVPEYLVIGGADVKSQVDARCLASFRRKQGSLAA